MEVYEEMCGWNGWSKFLGKWKTGDTPPNPPGGAFPGLWGKFAERCPKCLHQRLAGGGQGSPMLWEGCSVRDHPGKWQGLLLFTAEGNSLPREGLCGFYLYVRWWIWKCTSLGLSRTARQAVTLGLARTYWAPVSPAVSGRCSDSSTLWQLHSSLACRV